MQFYNTPFRLARRNLSATPTCSGGNCWLPGKATPLHADTPCCRVPGFSRCTHTTPIAVRDGESGDSVASRRNSTATECACPEWSRTKVITYIAAASALLADGWSTESVSSVERTTRTTRENHEREHAEHVYYSHIHDGVTISDSFAAIGPGFEEEENLTKNTTAQDDQEHETEKSLSESLQTTTNFEGS